MVQEFHRWDIGKAQTDPDFYQPFHSGQWSSLNVGGSESEEAMSRLAIEQAHGAVSGQWEPAREPRVNYQCSSCVQSGQTGTNWGLLALVGGGLLVAWLLLRK